MSQAPFREEDLSEGNSFPRAEKRAHSFPSSKSWSGFPPKIGYDGIIQTVPPPDEEEGAPSKWTLSNPPQIKEKQYSAQYQKSLKEDETPSEKQKMCSQSRRTSQSKPPGQREVQNFFSSSAGVTFPFPHIFLMSFVRQQRKAFPLPGAPC